MGFSSPLGLVSLIFLAALVVLYLRERHQREIEVPSLLLWQAIREETERSRFRPNLLFLLQAALLAILAFAVARPYWTERAAPLTMGRTIFVFDTSASMQAIENGERRFDQARRKANEVLNGLDHGVEVMMIAVEAHPRVVVAFTRDHSALARALEALEPGDGPSRLSLGIQLARSMAGPSQDSLEIDVFTDLPRAELALAPVRGERLHTFRFGQSDDNVAIAALRVYQSPFQEAGEAQGYALVKNYSHREKELELHVTLQSRPLLEETLHLKPREGRVVAIHGLTQPGRVEARLDVADALGVDNRALAAVRSGRKIRVLAVTGNPAVAADLRAIARAVPAIELSEESPAQFRSDEYAGADVAIFHGFVPSDSPRANSLYVYPPAENPLFPSAREVVGAQILDWNDLDPILHDLRYVEALPLDHSRLLELPPWAHTLIASRAESRDFPLAFAGEIAGHRVICFAFDLAGRSLAKTENLSLLLLMLNALRWLTPPDPGAALQVDVGDTFRETFDQELPVSVIAPDGRSERRAPARQVAVEISRAGEYRIESGGVRRTVLANVFDGEESDIGRKDPPGDEVVGAETGPLAVVSAILQHEFGRSLLILGLLLAFIEWAVWIRSVWQGKSDVG